LDVVRRIILEVSHREVDIPGLILLSTECWLDLSIKLLDGIGKTFRLLQVKKFLVTDNILYGLFESLVENQRASYAALFRFSSSVLRMYLETSYLFRALVLSVPMDPHCQLRMKSNPRFLHLRRKAQTHHRPG
jgi:hypothetical protein